MAMPEGTKKYCAAILVSIFFAGCATIPENSPIEAAVKVHDESRLFTCGTWSVYAVHTDTGEAIIEHNIDKVLAIGSNMKIITGSAALSLLGPDYRFSTPVYYDGDIASGVLKGNIYIRGSGDPALASSLFSKEYSLSGLIDTLVEQLDVAGIESIGGSIVADSLLFPDKGIPEDWTWADLGTGYGAPTSALCINENVFVLTIRGGAEPGSPVTLIRTDPPTPTVEIENRFMTGTAGSYFRYEVTGLPLENTCSFSGSVPADGNEYTCRAAIPDPPLLLVRLITDRLITRGIPVSGKPYRLDTPVDYRDFHLLYTITSPKLKDILFMLFKRSVNLYAEQLCRAIGLATSGQASTAAGVKGIENFLTEKGLPMYCIHINDGSGLSRYTRVSTNLIVKLLCYMEKTDLFTGFYRAFGVAGDPEDLSFFADWGCGTAIAHNARIKSGSLKRVKAHSGYVRNRSGRLIAFSMIANNYDGIPEDVNEVHRDLITRLAELE
jgi:D-alanyl-D-alanine carboxypeptidase/D-alanyl-D-alanine-endopeptidase (penicillin-binding protein 4)